MKKILLLFILAFSFSFLQAQDQRIADTQIPLSDVERIVMPPLNNKNLLEAELAVRTKGRAPKFAEIMEVNITPQTHGTWDNINDNAVWRLRIHSANAKSLNLGFSKYLMPLGGSLVLYTPNRKHILGPFTPADNEEHEQLWTPILDGDELIIEVQVPKSKVEELQLELKTVNHDFVGFRDMAAVFSGSCNLDVICGEEDGWGIVEDYRDIIQSVAVYGMNGSTFCTGFLVNTVRQDCAAMFMTADHCGINSNNAASLVTYWNYQNSTCRQPNSSESGAGGDGTLTDFNTGAIFRAGHSPSDVTIVELDDPVSETANAFFAGWDATAAIAQNAIAVHHPNTEEKRISFENDPVYIGDYSSQPNPSGTHVIVGDWDIGTTEPGSSGSPLFNQDKRVIGQLHGGAAACGNDSYDAYGYFYTSWEGGGTPDTRLKDWLDPDNTGQMIIDGRQQTLCNFNVDATPQNQSICESDTLTYNLVASPAFVDEVTLSIPNLPEGLTATFTQNPIAPNTSTTLIITGTENLTAGTYSLDLTSTDGTETGVNALSVEIVTNLETTALPVNPLNNAENQPLVMDLTWEDIAMSYDIEIATDSDFNNIIVAESNINQALFNYSFEGSTQYYWRIKSGNACGQGDWSDTYNFSTATCSILEASNLNIPISATGASTISSTINVDFSGIINDLDVINIIGTHTYLNDLTFIITSPSGTQVTLLSQECGPNEDFNISFDDSGNATIPCPYNTGGAYAPQQPLSAFNGEQAAGIWELTITDDYNLDGGALENWGLQICAESIINSGLSATPATITICNSDIASFTVEPTGEYEGEFNITAESNPAGINFDIENPTISLGNSTTIVTNNLITVPQGEYTIIFTATNEDLTTTSNATLIVNTPPSISDLTYPVNGATDVFIIPTLNWETVAGNANCLLEVATDEDMTQLVLSEMVTSGTYTFENELQEQTTYYWRVTLNNDCGTSVSTVSNFTTEILDGVDDISGVHVALSPNPTNGLVNVRFGAAMTEQLTLEVFSLNGQLLKEQKVNVGATLATLNLSDYADGIYFIKVKSINDVLVKRIAVQR